MRVTPKSSANAIDGWERLADGRAVLKARVRSAPDKGAANRTLVELLAGVLETRPSEIVVVSGHASRLKTIDVGLSPDELERRLGFSLDD